MRRALRGWMRRAPMLAAALLLALAALSAGQAPPPTVPPTPAPAAPETTRTPAATTPAAPASPRTVAVDPAGGPPDLDARVAAAIAAWTKAAPSGLVGLSIQPKASSTIGYAAPALLGPDTLSLDLRVPGRPGVEVRLAGAAATHPMVLLHEVGVLLGLPEGGSGVMARGVPASGEPQAPTEADVQALRVQRTFAREDLNHDGKVDFYDLVLFGQAYGSQGVNLPADFNGDGKVDQADLALLEKAYAFSPPSSTAPGAATGNAASPQGKASLPSASQPAPATPSAPAPGGAPATPTAP